MGGRGTAFVDSDTKRKLKFGGGPGGEDLDLLPAKMNRLKNTGSLEKAIKAFNKIHTKESKEYGNLVDEYGYIATYKEEKSGSVSFGKNENEFKCKHLVHNHPKRGWGNFSGSDLQTFAETQLSGMTASSRNKKGDTNRRAGTYTIKKNHNFKSADFMKALRKVTIREHNYDKDLTKWLKRNQRKYGYKFTYKPAKNKKEK